MEKINGKLKGMTLDQALGRKTSIIGIESVVDYQLEISKMDKDVLYSHGMKTYGIRPSRGKNARPAFEKKCISAFRNKTGQAGVKQISQPKNPKSNKDALEAVLASIRPKTKA
jgi:hypothetical protein